MGAFDRIEMNREQKSMAALKYFLNESKLLCNFGELNRLFPKSYPSYIISDLLCNNKVIYTYFFI